MFAASLPCLIQLSFKDRRFVEDGCNWQLFIHLLDNIETRVQVVVNRTSHIILVIIRIWPLAQSEIDMGTSSRCTHVYSRYHKKVELALIQCNSTLLMLNIRTGLMDLHPLSSSS
jgi:hypothetical protein